MFWMVYGYIQRDSIISSIAWLQFSIPFFFAYSSKAFIWSGVKQIGIERFSLFIPITYLYANINILFLIFAQMLFYYFSAFDPIPLATLIMRIRNTSITKPFVRTSNLAIKWGSKCAHNHEAPLINSHILQLKLMENEVD